MNDICVCELCGYVWDDAEELDYDFNQDMYVCKISLEELSPCQAQGYVDWDGELE